MTEKTNVRGRNYFGKALLYRLFISAGVTIDSGGPNAVDDGGEKEADLYEHHTSFNVRYPRLSIDSKK